MDWQWLMFGFFLHIGAVMGVLNYLKSQRNGAGFKIMVLSVNTVILYYIACAYIVVHFKN